jgi:hypothetical protein
MRKRKYSVNDFVFVNRDRGLTPGIARVVRISANEEAEIVFEDGSTLVFYFAHLHQTPDCLLRKIKFLRERANKVGAGAAKKVAKARATKKT